MSKEIQVLSRRGDWLIREDDRVVSSHQTQQVAVERARKLARRNRSQLVIYNREGKVEQLVSPARRPGS